jgi:FLVCR family feline leukemia virus subgroup C receptor-related protein
MKNKSYIFLSFNFTFLYGIYTSLGATVNFITEPYGYTNTDNSIFAAVLIICGVLGSFVFGMVLAKTAKYKMVLFILGFGATAALSFGIYTLPSSSVPLFSVNLALIGITVVPIIPVSYAFAVELTYPLTEAMSNGMMVMLSQIFGTILGIACTVLADINPLICLGIFIASAACAAISTFFIKEDLRITKK